MFDFCKNFINVINKRREANTSSSGWLELVFLVYAKYRCLQFI